jgi:flagellar hook assembly protein FlgD
LSLLRTTEKVAVERQVTPAVHLASKPNPFLSSTDVSLSIASGQEGSLAVYDVTGRLVKTLYSGYLPEGAHTFRWDGKENTGLQVRSGVYFVRFEGKSSRVTGKLVLLKSH